MLIEIAHMGFGDRPQRELSVNLTIGRTLVLSEPATAHEHIVAIRGSPERAMRWAAAESKRMREPGHVVRAAAQACWAMERRPSSVCTVLSQAR